MFDCRDIQVSSVASRTRLLHGDERRIGIVGKCCHGTDNLLGAPTSRAWHVWRNPAWGGLGRAKQMAWPGRRLVAASGWSWPSNALQRTAVPSAQCPMPSAQCAGGGDLARLLGLVAEGCLAHAVPASARPVTVIQSGHSQATRRALPAFAWPGFPFGSGRFSPCRAQSAVLPAPALPHPHPHPHYQLALRSTSSLLPSPPQQHHLPPPNPHNCAL